MSVFVGDRLMQQRCALVSLIAMFGVAFLTLDRVPRAVLRVLQTQAELAMRADQRAFAAGSEC